MASPTATPLVPFIKRIGRRLGRETGSCRVPSKLGEKSTVPWFNSSIKASASGVIFDSV